MIFPGNQANVLSVEVDFGDAFINLLLFDSPFLAKQNKKSKRNLARTMDYL